MYIIKLDEDTFSFVRFQTKEFCERYISRRQKDGRKSKLYPQFFPPFDMHNALVGEILFSMKERGGMVGLL